jgi:hypothetical protein
MPLFGLLSFLTFLRNSFVEPVVLLQLEYPKHEALDDIPILRLSSFLK